MKPEVINQIKRLDLRAQFVVKGFLQGLHASPFHGFSVEFSEHRRYTPGDDPKDIDWLAYAKTDKYYVKKFEAETNITGYLAVDLSESMDFTYRQQLTKFDYAVCLAAALCYLMVYQNDPVGLITFLERLVAREESFPQIEWGIYRTHPPTRERVSLLVEELIGRGIEINRRAVTKSLMASARKAKVGGREAGEVAVGKEVVFRPVAPKGKEGPFERAKRYAEALNSLLLANLQAYELRKRLSPDGTGLIMARGRVLVEILPEDAKILGKPVDQLCNEAMRALKRAFIRERAREMLLTNIGG